MANLTEGIVDSYAGADRDVVVWDDELPGFGLRVAKSGKRSYIIAYRAQGRARRQTIGLHGVWTAEAARREARLRLSRLGCDGPAEPRRADRRELTVGELCDRYVHDLKAGLVRGRGGLPKKPSTVAFEVVSIARHLVPLLGQRRVRDLTEADLTQLMRDVAAGRTRRPAKGEGPHRRSSAQDNAALAKRTLGLLGGVLAYAQQIGLADNHLARGGRPSQTARGERPPAESGKVAAPAGEVALKSEFVAFKSNRIVEVASRLFYERGYSSCTLDNVASQLRVTKPFLYSYFANKEAILAAICEVGIRESLAVLEEVLARGHGSRRELLAEAVRKVGRIVIARQEYVVVYQREMKHLSADDHQRILRLRHSFDRQIGELIRDGVRSGEFGEDADPFVAVWIGGLISWIPTWYSPNGKRSAEEVIEHLVQAALRLARAA